MTDKTKSLTKQMKHRQKLIASFWRRFAADYLHHLSYTRLWHDNKVHSLTEGCVVQVIDPLNPRGKFTLGVVEELHHGRDGKVRSATLRLGPGKTTRRNLRQLAVFEYPGDSNTEDPAINEEN